MYAIRSYYGYLAVVRGYTAETGRIDHPLQERLDKIADRKATADKPPQPAVTDYRRLATRNNFV